MARWQLGSMERHPEIAETWAEIVEQLVLRIHTNADGKIEFKEYLTWLVGRGWRVEGAANAPESAVTPEDLADGGASGQQLESTEVPRALEPEDLDFSLLGTRCTRIDGAQNRAITLPQLRRIRDFIQSYADEDGTLEWIDLSDAKYSATSGQQLNVHNINLYQVSNKINSRYTSTHTMHAPNRGVCCE